MKRFLTILLCVVMVFTMMPVMTGIAFAGSTTTCTDGCTHEAQIGSVHYDTFGEAVNAVQKDERITLLKDVTLSNGVTIPDNISIALNEHKINRNGKSFTVGNDFAFEIATEKDLSNANTFFTGITGTYTLKLTNNFTITEEFFNSDNNLNIVLDGNNYTITAEVGNPSTVKSEQYAFYFMSSENTEGRQVTISNLDLEIKNGFRSGIQFHTKKKTDGVMTAVLENVTIKMNHTIAPRRDSKDKNCVPIQNNSSYITVKKSLNVVTDEFCWAAIDLSGMDSDKKATLTFDNDGDDKAVLTVNDNRVYGQIVKEPLIGTENLSYVSFTNLEDMGLISVTKVNDPYKYGYDMPAAKNGNTNYTTVQAAINAAADGDKLTLLYDVTENVTINKNITLDLNGHVLKGTGEGSVITNNAALIITDSNISAKHYFKYSKTGAWTIDTRASSGINISDITGSTVDNTIIEVTGGVITGGKETNNTKCGGAIFNHGTLTLQSGNIIGNTSERGGAVYNCMGYEMTMDGGLIAGNTSTNAGSGVNVPIGSKFTMNGGKIMNNTVVNNECGAVYVVGTFIMNDGEISNNKAKSGAGVYVYFDNTNPGTFRMNGGTIKNNTASDKGGGVYVDNYADVLLKGKIKNNTAGTLGGGVCCNSPITVGGNASITGNTVKGHANNVFLRVASKSNFSPLINFDSSLTENASIGVSVDKAPLGGATASPVQFASVSDIDYSACFTSDNGAYSVVYEDTTGIKDLKLKQTTFYVIDNVVNNGNDTTGNGTSAKPYATIQKAAEMANGTGVVKLLSGIDFTKNETLPDNTTILINGKDIRPNGYTLSGSNITVLIYNSTDFTAASALLKCLASTSACTFKLMNNIEISDALKLHGNIGNVTFDGNGKTISASSTSETSPYVFSIQNGETETRNFTLKNATLNVNNGFRYGIYLEGKNGNINATTEDVTINMNQTIAPKKNGVNKTTAIIMDNGADLTIKGNFIANTNEFCWTAINLDASNRNISLTFDDSAVVSISDYRTDEYKASKMLIAFDGNTTNACTASGKYITDYMAAIGTEGYNPLVTVTFDSNGGSVVDAKTTAQYYYVEKPTDPTYKGYSFGGWYSDTKCENAWDFDNDKVTEDITLYAKWTSNYSGGFGIGGAVSTRTPVVSVDTGATYELTDNSSKLTITVKEGYELVDVTVNGKSKGAISIVTGLKNGDNVVISTKKATNSEISQKDVNSVISGLAIRVNTKYVKKNGKKYVQAYTDILSGNEELNDILESGYTVKYVYYRSTSTKISSFKKIYTSTSSKYTNTKGAKGKKYFYRVVLKVYDQEGNLVASTPLKNCKYGSRMFK